MYNCGCYYSLDPCNNRRKRWIWATAKCCTAYPLPPGLCTQHRTGTTAYSSRWENEPRYKVKYILLYRHIILPPWPSSDQLQGVHGLKHAMCMNRSMPLQWSRKLEVKRQTQSLFLCLASMFMQQTFSQSNHRIWNSGHALALAVVLVKPPFILCVNSPIDFLRSLLLSHTAQYCPVTWIHSWTLKQAT